MSGFLKFLLIVCITAGAVYTGYRFLSIRTDFLFLKKEDAPQPDALVTTEILPVEEYTIQAEEAPPQTEMGNEQKIVAHVVDYLEVKGSEVMDSRYFADGAGCDAAVRTVAAEYRRRGIREQDITETAPFPDSKGAVVMFTNQGQLHYIGCMTPLSESWAVYVQFRPLGQQ